MRESPRLRRLRSDHAAMERLKADSSIVDFLTPGVLHGGAPEVYELYLHGRGVAKSPDTNEVHVETRHHVTIQLGASYPRMIPEMKWRSPVFHPNISAAGVVCLGGYSTHWVPSLQLDELCTMLWDMIRYANFDVDSPYNREAAQWVKTQAGVALPLDRRPLRNKLVGGPRKTGGGDGKRDDGKRAASSGFAAPQYTFQQPRATETDIQFMDLEVVDAEIVPMDDNSADPAEILYLE